MASSDTCGKELHPARNFQPVFSRARTWLRETYPTLERSPIDVDLPQDLRIVYSHLLNGTKREKPSLNEQSLMRLLGLSSLEDLNRVLSEPDDTNQSSSNEFACQEPEVAQHEGLSSEPLSKSDGLIHERRPIDHWNPWADALLVLTLISTGLVLLGIGRWPYGFYVFLRLILCLTAAVGLSRAFVEKRAFWLWFCGVAVVLYNPILPVKLGDKDLWMLLNALTSTFMWIAAVSTTRGLRHALHNKRS